MTAAEERMTILRLVEQGKISPEEGVRLLSALGRRDARPAETRPDLFDTSRQLHIRVSEIGAQRHRLDVALPVGLVRLALHYLPAGVQVDVAAIEEAIEAGVTGQLAEVIDQEHGVRVEIALR
jgi:hypothetical protein